MNVRPATRADEAALAALTAELGYPTDPGAFHVRLESILATSGNAIFVAETEIGVVGWLHVFLRPLLESDLSAEIGGLVVASAARRLGVGRGLITAAESWAQAQGARLLTVRCRTERLEGNRFYEALGFRVAKVQNVWRKPVER
ncbi:MAG TPA: GNAT family N-acetyltransferase [Candidatus Limnocylindria bacterium]|jgi:GNAT superfamily N-acetyltransferase|nr:GNAT family N-acetyltransferase [Candidatus Limnocylindria bacterium]